MPTNREQGDNIQIMLRIHSYESMGTFDGPGLRLVVFLQGCNFRCLYCANPDTIDACGGKPTPAEEILRMATDQKPFFGRRGGVTFSGGEPTFQATALVPLVRQLHGAGIHVCLDSNGGVWNPAVEELLGLVDLVLLDVKQADPERHRALTGRENAQTLRTAAWLEAHGKPFWLRYVLVPGISDAEADIRALGERLGGYKSVERVELLPYHTLGVHKYEAMGLEYKLRDVRENTPEQLDRAAALRVEASARDFMANATHELKTPIGAVSVLSEAVEAAYDDPEPGPMLRILVSRGYDPTTGVGAGKGLAVNGQRLASGYAVGIGQCHKITAKSAHFGLEQSYARGKLI